MKWIRIRRSFHPTAYTTLSPPSLTRKTLSNPFSFTTSSSLKGTGSSFRINIASPTAFFLFGSSFSTVRSARRLISMANAKDSH